jgi:chain length determinant protein EpsF
MTFGQFLSILRARKWVALMVFGVVVALTLAGSLLFPKTYTGTASVVIDSKPDPLTAMMNPASAMPSFMATQVDIMTSDRVALRVIRDLKLLDSPQVREQWQDATEGKGVIEQWLVEVLQKKLDVKPSRESNVITINYKSPDPNFAAGLANAFAQAYIATTLELRVDPAQQFKKFFDIQTKSALEAVQLAQGKVSAFQQQKGIIASDERMDVETMRLNELSSQVTQLQALSAESTSRQGQAQGTQSDRIQEVLNSPLIGGMKADLTRNEARLQELGAKYGDNHPLVIEAKANIAEQRNRIDAEVKRITSGVGVSNTINKAREGQIRVALETQRSKVLQMKAVRDEGLVLQREAENAQRIYDSLVARLSQSNLESQNTQSFANILTTAQPPADPSSPKIFLNTVLSVFVGLMLAIGVALVKELSDRRIRSAEDAVAALGLPVLGTLPKPGTKRFMAGHHALLPGQRSIGLPAPAATGLPGQGA